MYHFEYLDTAKVPKGSHVMRYTPSAVSGRSRISGVRPQWQALKKAPSPTSKLLPEARPKAVNGSKMGLARNGDTTFVLIRL